jgi:hypothetical protein
MGESAVVVATDGSTIGDALVQRGAVLAGASGSCLHIVGPEAALRAGVRAVADRNIEFELHVARGELRTAVWDVAEQVDADLVVVDRLVRNPLQRILRSLHARLARDGWVPVELIDRRALRAQLRASSGRIAAS